MTSLHLTVQETDLQIYADKLSEPNAREAVMDNRGYIENYIRQQPAFATTLTPWPRDPLAPVIVGKMITASRSAGVGPMAAVAGAVAEQVGLSLLGEATEVIVENGGDIFIYTPRPVTISVFAGTSPLSMKIGIELPAEHESRAVCTSSGTVGHSLSYGRADAVTVLSRSCPLADAAATAIANRIQAHEDIQPAIDWGRSIKGIDGLLVVLGDKMGMWGNLSIVPIT